MAAGDDSPARADPWRWTRVQASGSTPSFRRMWRRVEAVGVMCRATRRHRRRRTTPRRGSRDFRDAFTPAPGSADRERTNTVRPCRCLRQFRRANPQRIRRYRISRADAETRWHRVITEELREDSSIRLLLHDGSPQQVALACTRAAAHAQRIPHERQRAHLQAQMLLASSLLRRDESIRPRKSLHLR